VSHDGGRGRVDPRVQQQERLAYQQQQQQRRLRSKSTDQLHQMRQQQHNQRQQQQRHQQHSGDSADERVRLDSGTLKRMLKPVARTAPESPVTSPEGGRGRQFQGEPSDQPQGIRPNGYRDRQGGR